MSQGERALLWALARATGGLVPAEAPPAPPGSSPPTPTGLPPGIVAESPEAFADTLAFLEAARIR